MIQKMVKYAYKEYRDKISRKLLSKNWIKPYMRYKEIEIIEEVLETVRPKKCLEQGAGYSTLYFPKFLDKDATWISVEHDREWSKKIKNLNHSLNVKIFWIPPNHYPWSDINQDGSYSDLENYIEFLKKFGKFDFILVDGRARKDCLVAANHIIRDKGVIVLHDANRRYYHQPFKTYEYQVLFSDYCKDMGGLWIGSKGTKISSILDVNKHQRFWQYLNNSSIGKLLKI